MARYSVILISFGSLFITLLWGNPLMTLAMIVGWCFGAVAVYHFYHSQEREESKQRFNELDADIRKFEAEAEKRRNELWGK